MSKILVTGASGALGQQVVTDLSAKADASNVIALVRTDAQAASFASQGIETRHGDYNDPATLEAAFKGVDRLLLISSSDLENRSVQHQNAIAAAKSAGVGFVAYTSILDAANNPLTLAEDHKAAEELIAESGMSHTFLRNGWYAENMLMGLAQDLAMGQHFGAAGEGQFSFATRRDLAEAAAITMVGGYDGQTLELAGDTGVTMAEYCAILSDVSGKNVAYINMPEAAYKEALLGAGLPDMVASFLSATDAKAEKGVLQDDSKTLSKMLGRPTTPIGDVIKAALAQ